MTADLPSKPTELSRLVQVFNKNYCCELYYQQAFVGAVQSRIFLSEGPHAFFELSSDIGQNLSASISIIRVMCLANHSTGLHFPLSSVYPCFFFFHLLQDFFLLLVLNLDKRTNLKCMADFRFFFRMTARPHR